MHTVSKTAGAAVEQPHHRYHENIVEHKKHVNLLLFLITLVTAFAYLGWALVHLEYEYWYISIPYLLAELICLGCLLIWSGMMIPRRDHPPHGIGMPLDPPPVDVVVTCCGEPLPIIAKTLRAIARIEYPHYQVTVADDRNDPGVRQACEELGFNYIHRTEHEGRKAGNLNYALEQTRNPFVLALDCDQIPHHTILEVVMGYFSVPHIGFVTTYQAFDVPAGDPWGNRDRVFYGAMQPSRNDSNSAISCGSGVVYRRAALDDVGGFSTWNLVEDLYTSLLLHNAGWKSVYHPFPLTHGTAPAEVTGHVRQRWQWAVDSMRILFWRNPMFTKGLTWRQRFSYLGFGYNYLVFGLAFPIFFMIPIWGLISGNFMMNIEIVDFIIWRSPYLVAYILLNRFLTDHRHNSKTFRAQVGLFMVFISAIFTAAFSKNRVPRYSVTHKSVDQPPLTTRLTYVLGHLCLMAACIASISYGYMRLGGEVGVLYWVNAVWAGWVVWMLLPFTMTALKKPPKEVRH